MMTRLDRLLETVGPFYERNDPGHDLAHAVRVAKLARVIAAQEGGELTIILPAALCHDLRRWELASHSGETTDLVTGILLRVGYELAEVRSIVRAVQRHSFSAPQAPETLEEKTLFDADKLEGLGAIGIGRCFAVSGALSQAIVGEVSSTRTAQYWLISQLSKNYDRLYTETAKAMGRARHLFLLSFIEQLQAELGVVAIPMVGARA
nr:HD domain-containing protein [Deinococcota bacterium]